MIQQTLTHASCYEFLTPDSNFPEEPNLLHWFKRLCFPEPLLGLTTDTLRHQLLELPGKLNYTAGKNVLLLPKNYPYQGPFLKAVQRVAKLKKRPAP